MRTKLDLLRINEPLFTLDFYVIVETSLNSNFLSSELGFSSFEIYRCDRDYTNSGVSLGGGVLICVKKKFFSKRLYTLSTPNFEHLFIHVRVDNKDLIIAGVYFPPKSNNDCYVTFFNALNLIVSSHPNYEIIICGDFNLPKLNWVVYNDYVKCHGNIYSQAATVIDEFAYLNCRQFNKCYNLSGSLLDLVFSNIPKVYVLDDADKAILPLDTLYHPALYISFNISTCCYKSDPIPSYFDFNRTDFYGLSYALNSCNWNEILSSPDINIATSCFYSTLNNHIELFVPKITPKKKQISLLGIVIT